MLLLHIFSCVKFPFSMFLSMHISLQWDEVIDENTASLQTMRSNECECVCIQISPTHSSLVKHIEGNTEAFFAQSRAPFLIYDAFSHFSCLFSLIFLYAADFGKFLSLCFWYHWGSSLVDWWCVNFQLTTNYYVTSHPYLPLHASLLASSFINYVLFFLIWKLSYLHLHSHFSAFFLCITFPM
jgi:hypothetical protein